MGSEVNVEDTFTTPTIMFAVTAAQFDLVYNSLSFTFASMAASTIFFWLRLGSVSEQYKAALTITGLVTFIAAYHYLRIFDSWVAAYEYPAAPDGKIGDPVISGTPFNDAYRYMDWLLTVPLLLIEIVLCMKLPAGEMAWTATKLGVASGLMIIIGYPGELIVEGDLSQRLNYFYGAMVPFLYVVYTLLIGLRAATESESDPEVKSLLYLACWATVISWCTYPFVYVIPLMGVSGASAVIGIQLGYCVSDIISKCGVGLLIYNITIKKSAAAKGSEGYTTLH